MSEIPITFSTGDGTYGFVDLHRQYSSTSYGEILSPRVRFGRYRPESVSEEEWQAILGADANNLEHMRLTYGLARQFIRYHNEYSSDTLSLRDQEDLLLAATTHDWAEAVVGDVMFDLKTQDVETQEASAMRIIINEMFSDSGEELPQRIEHVIATVAENHSTRLGEMFHVIEQLGYLRTGLRAFDISQQTGQSDLQMGLQWASSNVLFNQIPSLLQRSEQYPAVDIFLRENMHRISHAFNTISDTVFDMYEDGEKERKLRQWNQSKLIWAESQLRDMQTAF